MEIDQNAIVNNINEYTSTVAQIIEPLQYAGVIPYYRGHGCNNYKIIPTIARTGLSIEQILKYESNLYNNFLSKIVNNKIGQVGLSRPIENKGFLDNWYLSYQMRHLEIPSRLIDWTFDKYVALYFCVSDERCKSEDGHVWIYPSIKHFDKVYSDNIDFNRFKDEYLNLNAGDLDQETLSNYDPNDPKKILMVHNILRPQLGVAENRRMRQSGKFVLYPNHRLLEPMDIGITGSLMRKIVIPSNAKPQIQSQLEKMKIVNDNVLPPIDIETQKIIQEIIEMSK